MASAMHTSPSFSLCSGLPLLLPVHLSMILSSGLKEGVLLMYHITSFALFSFNYAPSDKKAVFIDLSADKRFNSCLFRKRALQGGWEDGGKGGVTFLLSTT